MTRYDGYNRKDFYFSNSCREAFGSDFHPDEKTIEVNIFALAVIVGFIVFAVLLLK